MATGQQNHVLQRLRGVLVQQGIAGLGDGELLARYVKQRDAAAFEALVRRHGPMVLGVCRRVLANPHDAEDAFQATFLVLLRKAAGLRSPGTLGNWLYGVAYRTALEARTRAARRRAKETSMTPRSQTPEETWAEVRQVLDEELDRLPPTYRTVIVLCDLEGKTRREAAVYLSCPEGTVAGRLARGRGMLAKRLTRRGVTLSAGILATVLAGRATASVSSAVLAATVGFTSLPPGGNIPLRVAGLAEGVLKGMLVHKLRAGMALLLMVGLLVTGVGLAAQGVPAVEPEAQPAAGERKAESREIRTDRQGDPLPAEALLRLGTLRFQHSGFITSVCFTPDGKQLVSHGYDGVRVWDAATGRETVQLAPERNGWVGAACLTPDGKTILTMEIDPKGNQHAICLRDRETLKLQRQFPVGYLGSPRFSPDGKLLVGINSPGGPAKSIEVWDISEGKRLRSWPAPEISTWACEFSPDGKTFVTGGEDNAIYFWDLATGEKQRKLTGHPNVVSKVALSADGKTLATLGMTEIKQGNMSVFPWDNLIRVWDVAAGKEVRQLTMPNKPGYQGRPQGFSQLAFASDGRTLVTVGQDALLRFWDTAKGTELRRVPLDNPGGMALAFSRDGKTLAVASDAIRLLDVASGKDLVPVPDRVGTVAVTPDGQALFTSSRKGAVVSWDGTTGRERWRVESSDPGLVSLKLTPDGRKLLATGSMARVARLLDPATGKELSRLKGTWSDYLPLAFSADGRTLAIATKEKTILLRDVETDRDVGKLGKHDEMVYGAAFLPDGKSLAAWCADHTVHVWDLSTAQELRKFEFADEPPGTPVRPVPVGAVGRTGWGYVAVASPDGRLIAYGSQARYLALHDTATGQVVQMLASLPDGPSAIAFSADSRTLAWGGWREPTIHLVEVATGKERHQLTGHKGRVNSLQFAADGKTLISGGEDATALVWDLTGKLAEKPENEPLPAAQLDACWTSLADMDAAKAYQAMRRLTASPMEAIPYLGNKVAPVPVVEEKQVAKLIADLDSDDFTVRESAFRELERLGEAATAGCRKALAGSPSAEIRRRLEPLLEAQAQAWRTPSVEQLRLLRVLEVLERAGTAEARQLLQKVAQGAPEARLTREATRSLERSSKQTIGER